MERDDTAPRRGYSTTSYITVLEEQIPRIWDPSRIFIQDNTPIHTAKKTKDWFIDNAITLLDWPPYSPDMNPIEHLWHALKSRVIQDHPELSEMDTKPENYQALCRAIQQAWDELDQSLINQLISSMPNRIKALGSAKGWHTKY